MTAAATVTGMSVFPEPAGHDLPSLRRRLGPITEAAARAAAAFDALRPLQDASGAVTGDRAKAAELLETAVDGVRQAARLLDQEAFASALAADVAAWRSTGLATPPLFDRTRDAYRPPAGNGPTLFAGPVLATNGPAPRGHFLELFLAWRDEPAECDAVAGDWPHPKNKCQSTRLILASRGFSSGNCIVFFPENIAAAGAPTGQDYALFFFNKFHRIYHEQTLPELRRLFGPADRLTGAGNWVSGTLGEAACYRARCVWGYLHDCFHHRGPRPLDAHLHVKLNWFTGLLEEIKVDAETALACLDGAVPHGEAILQFVLFERMLRYPRQPDATRNFDSATGVLLYEWLRDKGAIHPAEEGRLAIDRSRLADALAALVDEVLRLEMIGDDSRYKTEARTLVRGLLPEGASGERFAVPARFAADIGLTARPETLDFESLAY
ncbi:MAG: DUF6421 family protein [Azospirillaceae bacterium]